MREWREIPAKTERARNSASASHTEQNHPGDANGLAVPLVGPEIRSGKDHQEKDRLAQHPIAATLDETSSELVA